MRNLLLLTEVIFYALFIGCKKNSSSTVVFSTDSQIQSAKFFFESHSPNVNSSNPRFSLKKTVAWNNATVLPFQKFLAVAAPLHYQRSAYMTSMLDTKRLYDINEISWILIYKDSSQNYHLEQIAYLPDSNFQKNKPFTGLIAVDDWNGNSIKKYLIQKDNQVLESKNDMLRINPAAKENGFQENEVSIIETCYTSYGYNYSVDDPDNGTYWSEPAGCTYSISSDNLGGSYSGIANSGNGAGGSGISPASSFSVLSPNNPIADIIDYNKCFTNIAGSPNTFSVMVCIDQPKPGTRVAWTVSGSGAVASSSGGSPADVGHTFLVFKQSTGSSTIVRNIGFYPGASVGPVNPAVQGQLNDDEVHAYNISLTVTLTNSQFFNMLNYADQGNNAGFLYDLNTNNCTTFALDVLSAGSVNLPRTIGSWLSGSGNDPGDLGEDIRSMSLSSNMTRSVIDNYHPNTGTCN